MKVPFFRKNNEALTHPAPDTQGGGGGGFLAGLKNGISKTRSILTSRIDDLLRGRKEISGELFDELEEVLITADIGVNAAHKLIGAVQAKISRGEAERPEVIRQYLKQAIYTVLCSAEQTSVALPAKPYIIMVAGVNGTGKTTTIAKMAHYYSMRGQRVLLAAADTFRAAAIEQLGIWSNKIGCDLVSQKPGSDPSAVVHDAVKAAFSRSSDTLIIDTAGRMHTKANLMEELKKMCRVAGRACPGAPHETFLAIDATSGMNALSQAKMFQQALSLTGIVLTKLDGTSKGGIIISIADDFAVPIRFIGMGEGLDALKEFKAREFTDALFGEV